MSKKRKNPVSDFAIIQAYKVHRCGHAVARLLDIGSTTVYRALAKNGVQRVGLNEYRKTMSSPKSEPYIGVYNGPTQQILEWYADGESMLGIAHRIGRSTRVVMRILHQEGVARPFAARGDGHSNWKGGRVHAGNGYIRVWVHDDDPMASMRTHHDYILEHRLVMARFLKRPLSRSESIHHINGDRSDNRIENLQIRHGKHGNGVKMCCLDCGSHNIGHRPL